MDRPWIPTVAGVIEIVAAISGLIGSAMLVFSCLMMGAVPDIQNDPDVPVEMIMGLLAVIAGFVLLGSVISLIGGVSAIRRRGWGRALAGSIAALFILPPAGILALVMTIFGENEFEERRSEPREGSL